MPYARWIDDILSIFCGDSTGVIRYNEDKKGEPNRRLALLLYIKIKTN